MSEYQFYGFQAVDGRLSPDEQQALRAISTRAEITSSTFTNSYSWGDLKGDPLDFMAKWFDLHVYLTNWGTRRFVVRLPKPLIDLDDLQERLGRFEDLVTTKETDDHLIVDVSWTDEEADDEWIDEEYWLPALAPIRADLIDGDLRVLYLIWLKALDLDVLDDSLEKGEDEDFRGIRMMEPDDPEPMSGIGLLNEQLQAFATFFRINSDLLEAAAERSPERQGISAKTVEAAIARVPAEVTSAVLKRLYAGDPTAMNEWRGAVRAALPPDPAESPNGINPRTASEILARSIEIRTARELAEAERVREEERRTAREVEAAARLRIERLKGRMSERAERVWSEVESEVERRNAGGYDRAAALLRDMQLIALEQGTDDEFARRLEQLRERHARKTRFIDRLADV